MILRGDLLRAQMLLHRHREVGAALDRRVVRDDDDFRAVHLANACDYTRSGRATVVHAIGRKRRELEERRAGVEQRADAIARQELAALGVLAPRILAAAFGRDGDALLELV